MSDAVTITLPGPPVAYAIDPARLVAWLCERGYTLAPAHPDEWLWISYRKDAMNRILLPSPSEWEGDEYAAPLADSIREAAEIAGIEARDLAAQLAPPDAPGPALQWAHASADARAPVLATLDAPAVEHRAAATLARMADDVESALAHEGRALAFEAAAAVLRGAR